MKEVCNGVLKIAANGTTTKVMVSINPECTGLTICLKEVCIGWVSIWQKK